MRKKSKMPITRPAIRSLPVQLWPTADRATWEEACRPSVRLKRGGAASHLRPVVQHDLARRYGLFPRLLVEGGSAADADTAAAAQVTPDNVQVYVTELKGRVSSVTVYGSILKLRRIVQLIAPDRDIGWLIEIERQLFTGTAAPPKMGPRRLRRCPGRRRPDPHGRS